MKNKISTILSIIIFSHGATAQTDHIFKGSFEFVSRLNDTGITWAGQRAIHNNTTCTSDIVGSQDCHQGRDYTHNNNSDGHAGFSFTKLDNNGNPLANQSVDYATTPWACVKDNVTGLIWEVKTTIAGIHHKDNYYQWGGITAIGLDHPDLDPFYQDIAYHDDWNVLVNGSNANSLCAINNWRVPTISELNSIVDRGITSIPIVDTNYFPNTKTSEYWSSSPVADKGFIEAWIIQFGEPSAYYWANNIANPSNNNYVRLVYSGN